jgi:hypothetical protein
MVSYPTIYCRECGIEVARTAKAGRPRKTHAECAAKVAPAPRKVEFAVNVNEPGEEANFIQVSSNNGEFWNAMAAKALMRRAAHDGGEIPATDPQA